MNTENGQGDGGEFGQGSSGRGSSGRSLLAWVGRSTAAVAAVLGLGSLAALGGPSAGADSRGGAGPARHVSGSCTGNLPSGTVVGMAATSDDGGYWIANRYGQVVACGDAADFGSLGIAPSHPIEGIAATPDGGGFWLVATDGGIFSFGDAQFYGSTGAISLNRPVVGMAATPTGHGYWLVAADGGIFSFGDAQFYGSTGSLQLNAPIVGMAATRTGAGYWLVATDGGIFTFGDGQFFGSMGAIPLNRPVVGMSLDRTTGGYWLVAADGGIFSFNAPFFGSTGSIVLNQPIVGMESNTSGSAYRFVASDGGVFDFGDPFFGSAVAPALPSCTVTISDPAPSAGATETASVQSTVAEAPVSLSLFYKTVTTPHTGSTDGSGTRPSPSTSAVRPRGSPWMSSSMWAVAPHLARRASPRCDRCRQRRRRPPGGWRPGPSGRGPDPCLIPPAMPSTPRTSTATGPRPIRCGTSPTISTSWVGTGQSRAIRGSGSIPTWG